ncbi:hypothetical protein H8D57_02205, partial [bacterium]|nr:hypothetical protein [bacterium]
MRSFIKLFFIVVVFLTAINSDIYADIMVDPFGFSTILENEDELVQDLKLINTGEELVTFQIKRAVFDLVARDNPEDLNILIFTDGGGYGGAHAFLEGAIEAEVPEDNVIEVGSAEADDIDLDEFNVIAWCTAHLNAYYQVYNDNAERFEEWVADGGILIMNPAGSAINPQLEAPGGVVRDNGATDQDNDREEDCDLENPLIAGYLDDDEDDFPERIHGTSRSHQAFTRGDFEDNDEIENPQIFYHTVNDENRIT